MKSLNKVQIIGNVCQEPIVRQTQNGVNVCSFSVATNNKFKVGDDWKEEAEFHNIIAWSKLADIVEQYIDKGDKIYIEGRLQTNKWEDQSGNKKQKTEIIAKEIIMLGNNNSDKSRQSFQTNQHKLL